MFFLHLLSYGALAVGGIFVLLSLASGLLYVAEVIEEHSNLAKTAGQWLIYAEILLYLVLFFVDGLPLHIVAAGIFAHLVYFTNFSRSWPVISLTSLSFIASCICVLTSHFLSFRHFSHHTAQHNRYTHYNAYSHRGNKSDEPTFLDIATYFTVCVWLVPFYLFLSLSANDNVLPSAGETPAVGQRSSAAKGAPAPQLNPPSPALSSAPSSPNLSRHTRQRSSMMKTALSSAFSIVPSALRPSTLSSHLPMLQTLPGGARNDLPRSPSPTFSFQPYASQPAYTSSLSQSISSAAPLKQPSAGWAPPLSPVGTGLGFASPSLAADRGGALNSPSLSSSMNGGRTLNFSPNPSPSSATFPPHSPVTPYGPSGGFGAGVGGGGTGGGGAGAADMLRSRSEQRFAAPPPLGDRRMTENIAGGRGGPQRPQGVLKRRGTTDEAGRSMI